MAGVLEFLDNLLGAQRHSPCELTDDLLVQPEFSFGTLMPTLEELKKGLLVRVRTIGVFGDQHPLDIWVFVDASSFTICDRLAKRYPLIKAFRVGTSAADGSPILAHYTQLKFDAFGGENTGGLSTLITLFNIFQSIGIDIDGNAGKSIILDGLMKLRITETEEDFEKHQRQRELLDKRKQDKETQEEQESAARKRSKAAAAATPSSVAVQPHPNNGV